MVFVVCVHVCILGPCGSGRGGKKAHSSERFSQITSASGGEGGLFVHNDSLLLFTLRKEQQLFFNLNSISQS